jgi:hypothetical protein
MVRTKHLSFFADSFLEDSIGRFISPKESAISSYLQKLTNWRAFFTHDLLLGLTWQ